MQKQVLDHEEIEWQLEAVDLTLVDNWLKEHPSAAEVAVVPGGARELNDVYYDTEDWRFYRAGYRMRVRNTDGESAQATMKALASAEGGLRRGREISEPLEDVEILKGISGPVGDRSRRLAGSADLRPLFEVRTVDVAVHPRPCGGEHSEAARLVAVYPMLPAQGRHPQPVDQDDGVGGGRVGGVFGGDEDR
jgi:CYTH domain